MAVITGGKTISQLTSIASLSPTTLFHVVEAGVNNSITRANLYTDISTTLGLGTAAFLDVGTGPNNVVQLDAGGLLPAVDGSQLINLPMFTLASGSGTTANGSAVDLGGALAGDVTITGSSDAFTIRNNATGFTQLVVGGSGGNAARTIIESDSGTDLTSSVTVNNQVLTLFARDGNSGIEESQIQMNGSVMTLSSPSDGATWQGAEYDQDISANFTANSLVNRAYVDAQTFLLANGEGTTANGSAVDLGGTYSASVTIVSSSAATEFAIQSQNGNEVQVRNADVQLNTGTGETPGSDRGHIDVADALVKLEAESSADGPVGLELGSSGGDVFFRYNATFGVPTSFASGEIPTAEYLHSTFGESQIAANVRNPGASEDGQHLTWNDGASEWQLEAPPTVVGSSGAAGEIQFSDGSGGFDSNPLFTAVFGGSVPSIDISGEVTTAAAIGFNVGDVYVGGNATHNVYKYAGGVNTVTYGTSFDPIAILANGTDVFISIGAPLNQVFRYADGGAFGAAITGFTTPGFIANGNSKLYIGDVNEINVYNEAAPNTALPTENIGSGILNDVRGIAVDTINNRVYAVDATNNIVNVFDITTPTSPTQVPGEEFGSGDFTNPSNIQIVGGKAYVGNRGTGQILVYDVATQTAIPAETIAIASLEQFYLDGTTLYATTQSNSLTIQSIASPLVTIGAETTMQSNKIIDLASPTNAGDAVNKGYADANLGGNALDTTVIVPGAPEDGFVVAWNDTNSEYELVSPGGGGGIGGTIADNQVAVGAAAANTIEGDNNFTWDGATLAITGSLTIDNLSLNGFTIQNTGGNVGLNPSSGIVDMNTSRLTNVNDPTAAQDAATMAYADANLGGNALDTTVTNPGAPEDGQVVAWNDTNSEYELITPPSSGSSSGEYTPVGTNVSNVSSSTFSANSGRFTSVGSGTNNIVTVFMEVSITPTAGSTLTQLRVTLPVAATLSASHDLIGSGAVATAFSTAYGGVQVQSDTANNEALIEFISESTNNHVVRCSFSYLDN